MKCSIILFELILVACTAFIPGCIGRPCEHLNGVYEPSKLTRYCTEDLLDLLDFFVCKSLTRSEDAELISNIYRELATRSTRETKTILQRIMTSDNYCLKVVIVMNILSDIKDKRILETYKRLMNEELDRYMYYIVLYVAKTGDTKALDILNKNYYRYGVSSAEWAEAIKLFGKFRYELAAPHMVNSLQSASINVIEASVESLEQIYPYSKKFEEFDTLADLQNYWENVLEEKKVGS